MDVQEQASQQLTESPTPPHFSIITLLIFGIVMLLIGIAVGYLLFGNTGSNSQKAEKVPEKIDTTYPTQISPTNQPSTASDATSEWRMYIDKTTETTFKYPDWKIISENEDKSMLIVKFEILGSVYTYERNESTRITEPNNPSSKILNGINWKMAEGEFKYKCVTQACIVHYTTNGKYTYSLYGPTDTVDLQDLILSTFKFNN